MEKDCRARGLNMKDAMDRSRWRKQIGMIDDHDACEWVNVSSRQIPQSRKTVVCCVCVFVFILTTLWHHHNLHQCWNLPVFH